MHKTINETAAEAYARIRADIDAMLDLIGQELINWDEEAKAEPRNWNLAGSAAHVRQSLKEMLISVMDAHDETEAGEMIEETLTELRVA